MYQKNFFTKIKNTPQKKSKKINKSVPCQACYREGYFDFSTWKFRAKIYYLYRQK